MVKKEDVEQLMLQHLPSCPLCKAKNGYEVSGLFKKYVQCNSCKAQWMSNDFVTCKELNVLKLRKTSRSGQGKPFKNKDHPVIFWQEMMHAKDVMEFLEKRTLIEDLFKKLATKDENVRKEAQTKLREIGQPVLEKINEMFKTEQSTRAIDLLGHIGDLGIEPLTQILKENESAEFRNTAVHSLLQIEKLSKTGKAIDSIIWTLKNDEDLHVRMYATFALSEIKGYPRVIDALIEALNDSEQQEEVTKGSFLGMPITAGYINVRVNAVEALKKIGDERGLKAIISPYLQMLKDHDWKTRKRAIEKIAEMGGAQTVQLLSDSLKDEHWEVRKMAAESLGKIKDVKAVEGLAHALRDEPDLKVREKEVEALGKIQDSRVVDHLLNALKDESDIIRRKTVDALRKIKDFRAVEPLIQALNDESINVRQIAALALGDFGDPRAIKALTKAKEDKSWWVRNAAKGALKKIQNN